MTIEGPCPTCGAAVRVVGDDEGTMHYEPTGDLDLIRAAGIRLAALLDETLGSAPGTVSAEDVDAALARWDALVPAHG